MEVAAEAAAAAPPAEREDAAARPELRTPTDYRGDMSQKGAERARAAWANKGDTVRALFREAKVAFPPAELTFRVHKAEAELEVWAAGEQKGKMQLVATYGICTMSGGAGPKRKEGDLQVPEGFYRIEYFWPDSAFYLAGKVSYPNALDKQLGGATPGGDIMIHGGCASIGCIAMSDERIEELWVMGRSVMDAGKPVEMIILPGKDMSTYLDDAAQARHHAFWKNLDEGNRLFEARHVMPRVFIGWRGVYEFEDRG